MPQATVERSSAQAEEMRQQRNQEVRQLIGSTVNNAKAIFAQNTVAGQLTNKTAKTAPVKPVRNSISRTANNRQQQSPEPDKSQQQQQQPQQSDIENQEVIDTSTVTQSTNNNLQEPPIADHHLEEDDGDPYSTIKRSPYTKVATNIQNDASGNEKRADHVQTESQEQHNSAAKQTFDDPQPTAHTDGESV